MRVLAASDDIAVETGARSTAHWLADQTRDAHPAVRRAAVLADAVDARWRLVGDRLATGSVNVAQARVKVEALDALPSGLGDDLPVKGGGLSGREGRDSGAEGAAGAGPGGAGPPGPRGRGRGRVPAAGIPDHVAGRLRSYLDAYTSPRSSLVGEVDALPLSRRRGEAFCALLENLLGSGLPTHGGTATSVMVTLDLDQLITGLGVAKISAGDRITAEQARRACAAPLRLLAGRSGHRTAKSRSCDT